MRVTNVNCDGLARKRHASFTSSTPHHSHTPCQTSPAPQPTLKISNRPIRAARSSKIKEKHEPQCESTGASDDNRSSRSMLKYDTHQNQEDLSQHHSIWKEKGINNLPLVRQGTHGNQTINVQSVRYNNVTRDSFLPRKG